MTTWRLHGALIRKLRKQRNLSKEDLAAKAGISSRVLDDIELDKRGARPNTARLIAHVLGVELHQLVSSWRFAWNFVPDLPDGLRKEFKKALKLDVQGRHEEAIELGRSVVDALDIHDDASDYGVVCSRYAAFLSHGRRNEEALAVLEAYCETARKAELTPLPLATYHRGIILRRLGRLDEAEQIFRKLLDGPFYSIESQHQMGIVGLQLSKVARDSARTAQLDIAESLFLRAREGWSRERDPHRVGYSELRLAEVCAARGQHSQAICHAMEAGMIFARKGLDRYVVQAREARDRSLNWI